MAKKEKIKPNYIFINPNTPEQIMEVLKKIAWERLLKNHNANKESVQHEQEIQGVDGSSIPCLFPIQYYTVPPLQSTFPSPYYNFTYNH